MWSLVIGSRCSNFHSVLLLGGGDESSEAGAGMTYDAGELVPESSENDVFEGAGWVRAALMGVEWGYFRTFEVRPCTHVFF